MATQAKAPSLNPSSAPFFPGGTTGDSRRADHRLSGSSIASFRSRDGDDDHGSLSNQSIHSSPRLVSRPTSGLRASDAERPFAAFDPRMGQGEGLLPTLMGSLTFGGDGAPSGQVNGQVKYPPRLDTSARNVSSAPHSVPTSSSRSDFSNSSPPPGSLLSSQNGTNGQPDIAPISGRGGEADPEFEAYVKSSPFLNDMLDRLVRNEYASREIQRDISDVNRKLNLLLARTQPSEGAGGLLLPPSPRGASSSNVATPTLGTDFGKTPGAGSTQQYATQDEVKQLSQRINTLTTSVSQLLALQTKAHMQNVNASFTPQTPSAAAPIVAPVTPRLGIIADTPPNQTPALQSPAALQSPGTLSFQGLRDPRPSPRPAGSPLRQWSQGSLDLGTLPRDPNLVRHEALLNKRRPTGNLIRRESAGNVVTDDNWGGGSPREAGPNITKWDQLPLSVELQHAIVKYGVGPPNKIQQRAVPFLLRGSDIIAQAPPTQERIAAYVIPAIQVCLNTLSANVIPRGPMVVIVCTTVDQANQGHKMFRDLGAPIGVRAAIGTGGGGDVSQELRGFHQNMPHVICGTPQKLHALFTSNGGLSGGDVRFLVLDEVDQLIARNLHEFVFNIVRLLPTARRGGGTPAVSPAAAMTPAFNPFDAPFGASSPFQPTNRRFPQVLPSPAAETSPGVDRQTALFSNTVPQDVLNLANAIQMREPVRVLVRRDGTGPNVEATTSTRGLKQYYLYLAFTAGGRAEPTPSTPGGGLGIIGSGRGGAINPETEIARQWKLDALADLFDDIEVSQAIIHVGGMTALENVLYKLASKGLEVVPLHGDMNQGARMAAFNKFRSVNAPRQSATKILVVYDVPVKAPDVFQVPLVINYDLPKAVEDYAHRVAPAISNNHSRAGVVVNFVTATGGDVEMLRSIECFYKIKCPEVPISLRDVL